MVLTLALVAGAFSAFTGVGISWSVLRMAYPTFLLITKRDDFLRTHQLQEKRILEAVPVLFLNVVATSSLFWLVPADQRMWVGVAVFGLLASLAWGISVQIPTHRLLDKAEYDQRVLAKMVRNEWVRFLAVLVEAVSYCALLFRNL
jgi:uncharacterized BrkB/YihY/UPF0761 family membrane protein